MSEDVSLARSPRRLTAAPAAAEPVTGPVVRGEPAEPHAWMRHFWLWEVFFGVVLVATLVSIWDFGGPVTSRLAAAGFIAAMAGWYVAHRRRLRDPLLPLRPRLQYLGGLLVLFAPATALVPVSQIATSALLPQALIFLPLRWGLVALLLVLAASLAPPLLRDSYPASSAGLPSLVLQIAVPVAFAVVIGTWVTRIIQQSLGRSELIGQLRASQAEVSRLSHEAGVAAERQRLASDIHDTIAQGLSSVVMLVQAAEAELERDPALARTHLRLAGQTVRDNLDEARALVAALTPVALTGSPLPQALTRLAARIAPASTVTITGTPRQLPTAIEVVLLRAGQESLTNVVKHAAAATVAVSLSYAPDQVALRVIDDGCGFAADALADGYGLAGIRNRVGQVGGVVSVTSAPGHGTEVAIRVPA